MSLLHREPYSQAHYIPHQSHPAVALPLHFSVPSPQEALPTPCSPEHPIAKPF